VLGIVQGSGEKSGLVASLTYYWGFASRSGSSSTSFFTMERVLYFAGHSTYIKVQT
jgi:hypothetical protein